MVKIKNYEQRLKNKDFLIKKWRESIFLLQELIILFNNKNN